MAQIFEHVRNKFTPEQLEQMGNELVAAVGQVRELREEKAASMTNLGAAIKGSEKQVFALQRKLALGYEEVEVEVVYVLDKPTQGKKEVIRTDTSEVLRVEDMTTLERQQTSFGFNE